MQKMFVVQPNPLIITVNYDRNMFIVHATSRTSSHRFHLYGWCSKERGMIYDNKGTLQIAANLYNLNLPF
jgi:hypothetical protein